MKQRNLTEHQHLELHRLSKRDEIDPDSSAGNALHHLTRYSFGLFQKNMKGYKYYSKVPVVEFDKLIGNKIVHNHSDPSNAIFIPIGDRCPIPQCISMDYQCTHELVNDDGQFILNKWATRYWCDNTYRNKFGDHGYHITRNIDGIVAQDEARIQESLDSANAEDDTNPTYQEGTAEDVVGTEDNSMTTATNPSETPCLHPNASVTPSSLYNKLTTSFQPLAEDISKHPELANMLHGFIKKAHHFLCDSKKLDLK